VRLGYFAMPMHPQGRDWSETLREDREAVVLADRLGFYDAFIGEHLTDRHENITNSMIFLATLVPETDQIRLATGTTNLSHLHPALVAVHAAMFDHLSGGRFILGVGIVGRPLQRPRPEIVGTVVAPFSKGVIDVILRMWELDPPYDIDLPGNRFTVTTANTYNEDLGVGIVGRPLQRPRPEIVGTVVAPFSKGVVAMGARDFHPLSANFLLPQWVATHWPNYAQGKESVGAHVSTGDWRIARTIFVAEDAAVAERYGRTDANSPYRYYYGKMLAKMRALGRLGLFKSDKHQPEEEITLDRVLDDLVIAGTPDSVAEQVLAFREQTGDFGELVYAGLDWVDPELAKQSMELMATKVMPLVNDGIRTSDRAAASGTRA
jgi:alkanesulfonate monooxygenase SsuD/methylene tetrahydromethanopterin reductase-like flavin-dependent oxidoreductase (luciferase family)